MSNRFTFPSLDCRRFTLSSTFSFFTLSFPLKAWLSSWPPHLFQFNQTCLAASFCFTCVLICSTEQLGFCLALVLCHLFLFSFLNESVFFFLCLPALPCIQCWLCVSLLSFCSPALSILRCVILISPHLTWSVI